MTASALTAAPAFADWTPQQAVGRVLIASGVAFGSANLFQWGLLSGALPLHPAWLSLSWPVALAVFFSALIRVRRNPSPGARVAGRWSRLAVITMLSVVGVLLALSALTGNWGLMPWATVAIPVVYAGAWTVAAARTRNPVVLLPALAGVVGATAIALLLGTPAQSLAAAATQILTALIPGVVLIASRQKA